MYLKLLSLFEIWMNESSLFIISLKRDN